MISSFSYNDFAPVIITKAMDLYIKGITCLLRISISGKPPNREHCGERERREESVQQILTGLINTIVKQRETTTSFKKHYAAFLFN